MKEDIGCDDVSLHKIGLGDDITVGFPTIYTGVQIAVLP